MVISPKRAQYHMVCEPGLLNTETRPLWQATANPCFHGRYTLKGRSGSAFVQSLGPGAHKVLFEFSDHLWKVWGLILKAILPLLPSCWGFSFALGCGVSFFDGSQHSPIHGCSAASCNFVVLAGRDEHTCFYSAIFLLVFLVLHK